MLTETAQRSVQFLQPAQSWATSHTSVCHTDRQQSNWLAKTTEIYSIHHSDKSPSEGWPYPSVWVISFGDQESNKLWQLFAMNQCVCVSCSRLQWWGGQRCIISCCESVICHFMQRLQCQCSEDQNFWVIVFHFPSGMMSFSSSRHLDLQYYSFMNSVWRHCCWWKE